MPRRCDGASTPCPGPERSGRCCSRDRDASIRCSSNRARPRSARPMASCCCTTARTIPAPAIPRSRRSRISPARCCSTSPIRPRASHAVCTRSWHSTANGASAGQVDNVCFAQALVQLDGLWVLYFGMADSRIGARDGAGGLKTHRTASVATAPRCRSARATATFRRSRSRGARRDEATARKAGPDRRRGRDCCSPRRASRDRSRAATASGCRRVSISRRSAISGRSSSSVASRGATRPTHPLTKQRQVDRRREPGRKRRSVQDPPRRLSADRPGRFNGTVVVEWLNVSAGGDIPTDWIMAHNEFVRQRHAYGSASRRRPSASTASRRTTARPLRLAGAPGRQLLLRHLHPRRPRHSSRTPATVLGGLQPRAGDRGRRVAVGGPARHVHRRGPAARARLRRLHGAQPRRGRRTTHAGAAAGRPGPVAARRSATTSTCR